MPPDEPRPPNDIPKIDLTQGEKDDKGLASFESASDAARGERQALGWAALAAAAVVAFIINPVGVGLLLGSLLAFALQPAFERLRPRLGDRWAALTLVLGSMMTLAAMAGGLAWLFVWKGATLTRSWVESLGPGGPGGALVDALAGITRRFGIPSEDLTVRARALAENAAAQAAMVAEAIASATASAALGLLFAMLSMHFVLRNWDTVTKVVQEALPLRPDYTAELFSEFRRVGRTTLVGTAGTAVAQGALATLGFWLTGVPEPVFFGAAAAVMSLVPPVGAALVWAPAGVILIVQGHTARGVLELAWGTVMVALVSDYVIRPRLVGGGGESRTPMLVTFVALLGGVEAFGLKGLIVGPVLMSLAVAVLRLYALEARKRRTVRIARGR